MVSPAWAEPSIRVFRHVRAAQRLASTPSAAECFPPHAIDETQFPPYGLSGSVEL